MTYSNNYLPNTDSQRVGWLGNFNLKVGGYQTTLGLSPVDIQQVTDDNAMDAYMVNFLNIIKQTQQTARSYKDLLNHDSANHPQLGAVPTTPPLPTAPAQVTAGVFDRVRSLVQRIKNAPGYTNAIGQDLNIIAPANTIDITTISPVLKGRVDVGRPHLNWKKGVAEATDLYADHNDGNGFVLIGRLLRSEYLDVTPPSAGKFTDFYKYKAIFVIADMQVGLMSQVFTISVMKQ